MSIRIASRFRAVSTSVSPLRTLEPDGDVHRVGRQALLGELERDARARRVLEEQIDDRRAAERRHLLDGALADLLERLGGIENEKYLFARQRLEAEEVLAERACHGSSSPRAGTMTTAVRPSSSSTMTSTRSPGLDGDRLADDVRVDWKLASSAIDEDRERDPRGPAEIGELVERRAHGAAGVENIVDDHDVHALDSPRQTRRADNRSRADGLEVVAVERDVERALRNLDSFALFDESDEPAGELHAATLNSDDDEIGRAVVQLDDLVGHSLQRPIDRAVRTVFCSVVRAAISAQYGARGGLIEAPRRGMNRQLRSGVRVVLRYSIVTPARDSTTLAAST